MAFQARQWQAYRSERGHIQAQVDTSGFKTVVAEAVSDGFHANTTLQKSHRERVPQTIGRARRQRKPASVCDFVEDLAYRCVFYSSSRTARTQKQLRMIRIGAPVTQVSAQ